MAAPYYTREQIEALRSTPARPFTDAELIEALLDIRDDAVRLFQTRRERVINQVIERIKETAR